MQELPSFFKAGKRKVSQEIMTPLPRCPYTGDSGSPDIQAE